MGPLMGSHGDQGEVECCSLGGNITSSRLFLTSYLTKKSSNNTQNDWSHYSPPCPVLPLVWSGHPAGDQYDPVYLGNFQQPSHSVAGDIFVLDEKTIYIQDFAHDGQAPDVFFWADGVIIPYITRSNLE